MTCETVAANISVELYYMLARACELLLVLTMQLTARHEIEVSGRVQQ